MFDFRKKMMLAMALAGAASMGSLGPASAQDAYTTEDIIAHFANSLDTGGERGLCIGTASECGETVEVAEPSPFDLRIQFGLNSASLTPEAQRQLDTFAAAMQDKRLNRATFNIDGHTDALGQDNTNQRLSERRAASVVSYLVAKGISPDKLVAHGYGETKPLVEDAYDDRNRRVEASLAGIE